MVIYLLCFANFTSSTQKKTDTTIHKNIQHTVSDKAGYMLQHKPITAALTNEHDKFYIIYSTIIKASLHLKKMTLYSY